MSAHDTLARVQRVIAANRELALESVRYESRLVEDLGIDSLAATEIVFDIEDEFGIVVPEQRTITFATVGQICDAVDELAGQS